jgi:hypothetical protein
MGAHLDSKTSSVNIIPKEKVVCFIQIPTDFKYLHKIILWVEAKASAIRGSMLTRCSHIVHVYHRRLCEALNLGSVHSASQRHTGDRALHFERIWFRGQHTHTLPENCQCLNFGKTTLL